MGRKTQQNNITSLELIAKISKENTELMNEFLMYLKSVDRSPKTIESYKSDLLIFFVWNLQNNNNKFFVDLTKRDIIRYQNYLLTENGNSPNRVSRLKSTLSSLSNYIEAILDDTYKNYRNIIHKIENPTKEPVREKTIFTDEQIDYLLNYLVEKKKYQQACVVALAAMSGARLSELLRFRVDFFVDENIVFDSLYKTPKISTKGRGKNGKMLNKYVLLDFKKYFDLWMEQRKELGIESEYLFLTKRNGIWEPMKITTLHSWAEIFTKILGVDFYFHSLRHQLCSRLFRLSLPQNIIQEYFGWSSAEMLKIYNDADASEDFGKYFTKDGIIEGKTGGFEDIK